MQMPQSADTSAKLGERWFPEEFLLSSELDSNDQESIRESLELQSLQLMNNLLAQHMSEESDEGNSSESDCSEAYGIAKGRFQDLCCTLDGELLLESLFEKASTEEDRIVHGAIISLQSLLILGTQYGVKATAEQFERSVSHLVDFQEDLVRSSRFSEWDASSTRRLKYESNRVPGHRLLAELKRKRTAQGAFDFLVKIGAWQTHEDLALLRSGFSVRFTDVEVDAAEQVSLFVGYS
jgi:hypothetical protein